MEEFGEPAVELVQGRVGTDHAITVVLWYRAIHRARVNGGAGDASRQQRGSPVSEDGLHFVTSSLCAASIAC